jgi:hypothetical protein
MKKTLPAVSDNDSTLPAEVFFAILLIPGLTHKAHPFCWKLLDRQTLNQCLKALSRLVNRRLAIRDLLTD